MARVIAHYADGSSRHVDAYERRDLQSFQRGARARDPMVTFSVIRKPMILAPTERPWQRQLL